jgi:hypothetical protein
MTPNGTPVRTNSQLLSGKRGSAGAPSYDYDENPPPNEGISECNGSSFFNSYFGGIQSASAANEIYFMGIIDILQVYNTNKKMENFMKGFSHDR